MLSSIQKKMTALMPIQLIGACLLLIMANAHALELATKPIYSGGNIPPLVMIDLSKDHQLYFKAYNDYSDLDGDGNLETTYTNSIDYYGYFDSYKCYNYNTFSNRFEPFGVTTDKYCEGTNASKWSGNFLNWAAMSRMDAVRKLLYGGLRSTDSGNTTDNGTVTLGTTVLERSFQPMDAHAWAKFYNGADLIKLTPATSVGTGLTFCNVTPGSTSGTNQYSQTNTKAPLIRVAQGNYALWASNERWQCTWSEEQGASNSNNAAQSGIPAQGSNPSQSAKGFGSGSATGEYIARVKVCSANMLGKEKCEQYPDGTYKPVGLLQTYGERGLMKFGLMTGSYTKNISGGVLRRNITDFSREINVSTNGTFKPSDASGNDGKGIVYNINRMRIYGYNYNDGTYTQVNANSESCNFQMNGIVHSGGGTGQGDAANEGNCSSWGNPISEIFLESVRYFAGLQPTSAFTYTSSTNGTKDDKLGLTIESWTDPLSTANYCSPLNALVFNPAVSSYDDDQMDMTGVGSATSATAASLTNEVGVDESVTSGSQWLVGSNGTDNNGSCTEKTLSGLSAASGICPEAPTQKGTYLMAGAAYYAKTNRVRTTGAVANAVPGSDTRSLKVTTYGVQLATNTPNITVDVGGKQVKIIPSYRLNAGGKQVNGEKIYASGTLVDFKVVEKTSTSGKFYINWEDSNQGGDFDQDVWGTLSYVVDTSGTTPQIKITTQIFAASSANGQGFGYVISGTNKDGAHFHSGAYTFTYSDPTNVSVSPTTNVNASGGCKNCEAGQVATTATYNVTGANAGELKDPLWYAAKWGGFTGTTGKPDTVSKWDTRRADGSAGSDGVPDNYFFVANPTALEASLERAFISILSTSSASSVATNSSSLETGTTIYQARFNATDWSGQLLAYSIGLDGQISEAATWDAGQHVPAANSRVILTYDNRSDSNDAGIPFRWSDSFPYKDDLKFPLDGDARPEQRLEWIRGVQSEEGNSSSQLRKRAVTVLGDIVNSNPQYVGAPAAGFDDVDYFNFVRAHQDRTPMLYVGANDGMLHGFSAADGTEKLAFIPSSVIPNLKNLTQPSYAHQYFVDGSPVVGDAKVGEHTWKTLLIGGLGAGGRGIYALDVTDVDAFSEDHASSLVQWEFTNDNDPDLGYTFSRPSIVQMANGRWAAVFGSGYPGGSSPGKAALFIVFLDRTPGSKSWVDGTDYIKIPLNLTNGSGVALVNGLSTPSPIDIDADGVADFIYAGDLLGNIWKFDITSSDSAQWKVAYGTSSSPQPLFSARSAGGNVQPITSAPDIVRNPAGGFVVLFGTGQYVQDNDASNTATQTFYGIWDENRINGTTPSITRTNLVQQSILKELSVSSIDFRLTSDVPVTYTANTRGWYMDFMPPTSPSTPQGERVVYDSAVRNGRVIFTTIIPSDNMCSAGGRSWLMELDAVNGGALDTSPLDVNGDGVINNADLQQIIEGGAYQAVSGRSNPSIGLTPPPTVIGGPGEDKEHKIMSGSSGTTESVLESSSSSSGRLSWREIMQ